MGIMSVSVCDDMMTAHAWTPHWRVSQITAQRYVNGSSEDDIPAGLLLGAMPQATEDLLLGRTLPSDYPDSIQADGKGGRRGPFSWFRKR